MDPDQLADARAMILRCLERGLTETERSARARTASDHLTDLRQLDDLGSLIMPGVVRDAVQLETSTDARSRRDARAALAQLRAAAVSTLSDLIPQNVTTPAGLGTGIGHAAPLIRGYASPYDGSRLALPEITGGATDGQIVTKGDPVATDGTGDPFLVELADSERFTAGAWAWLARQVVDFATGEADAYLDQIVADICDRAAEREVGRQLIAAATTAAAGSDLAGALDTAEGLAGAALEAAVDLVVVNPADWPRVRRVVATSWAQQPAPAVAVSVAVPAKSVIVTGRDAFGLYAAPLDAVPVSTTGVHAPRQLASLVMATRDVTLAIRNSDGIRAVTL